MNAFNVERDFFITIIALNFPASKMQGYDLLSGICLEVEQIREQDGDRAIRTCQQDHTEFDGPKMDPLVARSFL